MRNPSLAGASRFFAFAREQQRLRSSSCSSSFAAGWQAAYGPAPSPTPAREAADASQAPPDRSAATAAAAAARGGGASWRRSFGTLSSPAAAAAAAASASASPPAAWQPPPLSPELLARQRVARAEALARRTRRAAGLADAGGSDGDSGDGDSGRASSSSPANNARVAAEPETPTRALLALLQEADAAGEPPLTSQALYGRAVAEWGGGGSSGAGGGGGGGCGASEESGAAADARPAGGDSGGGMFTSRRRFKGALAFLRRQGWVRPRPAQARGGRGAFCLALTDEGRAQRVGAGAAPPSAFWREALREVALREVVAALGAPEAANRSGGGGASSARGALA